MESVGAAFQLALEVALLAAAISMVVAVLIVIIGRVTSTVGAARDERVGSTQHDDDGAPRDDDIVAIAAAVQAAVGAHRIVHIEERRRAQSWIATGRSDHHHSHDPSRHTRRAPSTRRTP